MQLGIGMFRLNGEDAGDYPRLAAAADTVLIQRHWQEKQNPNGLDFAASVAAEAAKARAHGLKVAVGFECLSMDRRVLELPANLATKQGGFSNRTIQEAYRAVVRKVATDTKPDIFLLNIEVDGLDQYDSPGYQVYRRVFLDAYRSVKQASPNTKVAVSIRYMDRDGTGGIDASDRQIFRQYTEHFPNADMVAASVYPLCYLHPLLLPPTFLQDLAGLSSKPLFIAETGWPSQPFDLVSGYVFPASPEAQATYIDQLRTMAAPLGTKILGITYVSLTDPSLEMQAAIIAINPALKWYCSLSLLDAQRVAKPAYNRMVEWRGSN
jgi:hypothetical protein